MKTDEQTQKISNKLSQPRQKQSRYLQKFTVKNAYYIQTQEYNLQIAIQNVIIQSNVSNVEPSYSYSWYSESIQSQIQVERKQEEVIIFTYIEYDHKQKRGIKYMKWFNNAELSKLWQFCDVLTLREMFEYLKKQDCLQIAKQNGRFADILLTFVTAFNEKKYEKKVRIHMQRMNEPIEQSYRTYMQLIQSVNKFNTDELYKRIQKLEQQNKRLTKMVEGHQGEK